MILDMKGSYPSIGLERFCRLLGVTRQALYQHRWHSQGLAAEAELILEQVIEIRTRHPLIGTRKLYLLLEPFLQNHDIKLGRDKLFVWLGAYKLLVRKRRRSVSTTQSYHRFHKYPNLIRDLQLTGINQLWVSDITYYKLMGRFVYISLVTDAYSHKILGYQLSETLQTVHTIAALEMALKSMAGLVTHNIIHHSDRGIQYCSQGYVKLLGDKGIKISMTQSGDPLENPVAERVNGIIKEEYLKPYHYATLKQLEEKLSQAVGYYNGERPHMSCGMLTPQSVHDRNIVVKRSWKTYYKSKKEDVGS